MQFFCSVSPFDDYYFIFIGFIQVRISLKMEYFEYLNALCSENEETKPKRMKKKQYFLGITKS